MCCWKTTRMITPMPMNVQAPLSGKYWYILPSIRMTLAPKCHRNSTDVAPVDGLFCTRSKLYEFSPLTTASHAASAPAPRSFPCDLTKFSSPNQCRCTAHPRMSSSLFIVSDKRYAPILQSNETLIPPHQLHSLTKK